MIHVAQTGLSNNGENLNRRRSEQSNHGEQARHTRNFCEKLRKDNKDIAFQDLIDNFHKGTVTKDQLKEEFKKKLKKAPEEKRQFMGIKSDSDTDIDDFLSKTKCFENQFMHQVQGDILAKEKAQTEMVQDCVDVAHDEYSDFDEQELRDHLVRDMKTSPSRVKLFLESGKYRKTVIKKLPGSHALSTKSLGNVDFGSISEAIGKLDPTNPKRREIQEAWLKINSIVEPGENLATAFARVMESDTPPAYLAGAYEAFFADSNTIISRENREKILNFLTRQYVPVVPLGVLESVDPKFAKTTTVSESDKLWLKENPPDDTELANALEKDKIEQWKKTRKSYLGGGTGLMSTRNVPFETKIRLLSQFGSIGKVEKMEDYYKGKPDTIRRSTMTEDDYKEEFSKIYGFEPANVETRTGLVTEIVTMLGKRIDGIEHFEDGCVMEWKTKTAEGEEMTGYYILDQVPGDNPDEENMVTLRFLGNNKDPLSPAGIAMYYSGADFYHYLAGCSEQGHIQFGTRESFEGKMKTNLDEGRLPRYVNHEETYHELRQKFPEDINVDSEERLNAEVDQILNPNGEHPLEAKNKEDRELHEDMVFVAGESKIDTFQIKNIGDGTVTLWDGWGAGGNAQHEQTLTFREFILTIKNLKQKGLYRLNTNKKGMGTDEFNRICSDKNQYPDKENIFKKMSALRITKNESGAYELGKYEVKTGNSVITPVVKIGEKKDIFIESIENDGTVKYRQGTFTQSKYDKEKDVWIKKPGFKGTGVRSMSLSNLWAHLCNNPSFELQKPEETVEKKKKEEKNSGSLSWWNILLHTHSLGVILHGDLWKAPFKAWEEQHHKDHDFAGKMTAALAMEKLQNGGYGVISKFLNYTEFPTLMVADGNSSFQSYLDELVNKIDNMGSYHRTRLIKKWSTKEHFPSVKFMAAMMASMKIFGQLYPYDFGGDDYKNSDGSHEWFWYNSICHALDPNHKKYAHMPPHGGEPWPEKWTTAGGFKMNESDVCLQLFGEFQHPMLKNLGRRYQKYMVKDHPELLNGGEMNLNMRTSMEDKLDWMMENILEKKIPESFGKSTDMFLEYGYPVNVSTRPMAALLFGYRDRQMLAPTREHAKVQFQEGYHIPMFVFMQEPEHADIFRTTGIAMAYTISMGCGAELEKLVNEAEHNRLSGKVGKSWRKRFESFWSRHGDEMMYKLGGMKDPMLNLMINGPEVFDEMLSEQPPEKRAQYEKIRKHKDVLRAYYDRLAAVYDSPSHCEMNRGKGYYSGDHFRFRDGFESGYGGLSWINWDAYIDANLDKNYAKGEASTDGDGVFNEFRGFLYAIPDMAKKMVENMGFTDPSKKKKFIDKISRALYEKTISDNGGVGRLMKQKIDPANPKAEYCSMTAMMFEIIPIQKLTKQSNSKDDNERFQRYFEQMELSVKHAREIQEKEGYAAGLKYREKMAKKWSKIVKAEGDTRNYSLEQIEEADDPSQLSEVKKVQENTQARSGSVLVTRLGEFEATARNKGLPNRNTKKNSTEAEEEEMALSA